MNEYSVKVKLASSINDGGNRPNGEAIVTARIARLSREDIPELLEIRMFLATPSLVTTKETSAESLLFCVGGTQYLDFRDNHFDIRIIFPL